MFSKSDCTSSSSLSTSPNTPSTSSNSLLSQTESTHQDIKEANNKRDSISPTTKLDLINRLSSMLTSSKHTVSSNDLDLLRNNNNNAKSIYRNQFKNEINRISVSNVSSFDDNRKKRVSNIANLRSNFELKQQVGTLNDPNKPSLTQSRSFKLLQETLENGF